MRNSAIVVQAGRDMGLSERDVRIGVMTAMGESSLRVLDRGVVASPLGRFDAGPLDRHAVMGQAVRRVEREVLGVPRGGGDERGLDPPRVDAVLPVGVQDAGVLEFLDGVDGRLRRALLRLRIGARFPRGLLLLGR